RLPRTALFPYATLFRSPMKDCPRRGDRRRHSAESSETDRRKAGRETAGGTRQGGSAPPRSRRKPRTTGKGGEQGPVSIGQPDAIDRKSTRLNSSHVKIS